MPLYFIEMGQGIVASGDFRVCTSALYSCSFIAGHNGHQAGAYHYYAGGVEFESVLADMQAWAEVLMPTHLTVVTAEAMEGFADDALDDQRALSRWANGLCGAVALSRGTAVGMRWIGGQFAAASLTALPDASRYDRGDAISLDNRQAGAYTDAGHFTLVGRNLEKTPPKKASSSGGGKGRKGHCIIL